MRKSLIHFNNDPSIHSVKDVVHRTPNALLLHLPFSTTHWAILRPPTAASYVTLCPSTSSEGVHQSLGSNLLSPGGKRSSIALLIYRQPTICSGQKCKIDQLIGLKSVTPTGGSAVPPSRSKGESCIVRVMDSFGGHQQMILRSSFSPAQISCIVTGHDPSAGLVVGQESRQRAGPVWTVGELLKSANLLNCHLRQ